MTWREVCCHILLGAAFGGAVTFLVCIWFL
jgi:hypothetical protein